MINYVQFPEDYVSSKNIRFEAEGIRIFILIFTETWNYAPQAKILFVKLCSKNISIKN